MSVTASPLTLGRGTREGLERLGAFLARRPVPEVACLVWAAIMLGAKATGSWTVLRFAPDPLTGFSLLAGGAWARSHRADTRIGNLLLFASAAWFAEDLRTFEEPAVIATLGAFCMSASLPAMVWLGLAFPDGRLQGTPERAAVLAAAVIAVPLGFVGNLLVDIPPAHDAPQHLWPVDYTRVSHQTHDAIQIALQTLGGACAIWVAFLVGRRFVRSARPTRRFSTPFVVAAVVLAAVIVLHQIALAAGEHHRLNSPLLAIEQGLTVAVALAFPIGILRLRLARGGLARMLSGLSGSDQRLRDVLASGFDDPDLTLTLWDEAAGRWVDEHGDPAPAPEAGPGRAVIDLERGSSRAGAVVTDQTWTLDRDLIGAVGVAASLALENSRLVEGRRALVAVADAELRRLERDLHDGAQQQLVAVTMHLAELEGQLRNGGAEDAPERLAAARADLQRAIGEVRTLSAGGLPAELEDFGLEAAVESLACRSAIPLDVRFDLPRRPSRDIEVTAWFVICEALANAGKHAAARHVGVTVGLAGDALDVVVTDDGHGGADPAGRGLRALSERVASAGGRLAVDSPPAGGTVVRASLPFR